jgi:hypothetical protein
LVADVERVALLVPVAVGFESGDASRANVELKPNMVLLSIEAI